MDQQELDLEPISLLPFPWHYLTQCTFCDVESYYQNLHILLEVPDVWREIWLFNHTITLEATGICSLMILYSMNPNQGFQAETSLSRIHKFIVIF